MYVSGPDRGHRGVTRARSRSAAGRALGGLQVDGLGLVDGAVREAAVHGALIQDHGVLHVVARVGDDADDHVGALRVLVHTERVVLARAREGFLRRVDTVELAVRALLVRLHRALGCGEAARSRRAHACLQSSSRAMTAGACHQRWCRASETAPTPHRHGKAAVSTRHRSGEK